MKKIKYTPEAAEKLRALNGNITVLYGKEKAKKIVKTITDAIKGLLNNEKKGVSVSSMLGINSDFRYLVISRNYIFYKIESKYIKIINIYSEKEDFMWKLFGVDTTTQETIDYWYE